MTSIDESRDELTQQLNHWPLLQRLGLPSLGLRASERKLLLATVDVLLLNVALIISLILRTDLIPSLTALFGPIKWFVTLTAVWFFIATVFDAYNLARAASTTYSVRTIATASLLASVLYLAIPWLTPPVQNRTQAFLFVLLAVFGLILWRALYAQLFVQPTFQRRALVVGAGSSGQALVQAMQCDFARQDANPFRGTGYTLLGFIEDNPARGEETVAGVPILGNSQDLVWLARKLNADEIILAITDMYRMGPEVFEAILDCREQGIPVTKMSTVYERLTSRVPVEHASQDIETAAGINDNPFLRLYGAIKRLADVFGALLALPWLVLLVPLVALGNALTSPGPLFFRQQRVGRSGRPFNIIKFRSMIPNAEAQGEARWAASDDDRVTPIGRWLRWSHLDELPQIFNVLRGEMSMVGPRPERPEFVHHLAREIPFYRARHSVRPGITGWAQIHQDYGDSVEGAKEKLEYDLFYVKHAGPLLDLLILLRTLTKVVGLRGR